MRLRPIFIGFLALFPLLLACGGQSPDNDRRPAAAPSAAPAPAERAALRDTPHTSNAPRIVFLGDSLTAGLGLDPKHSFPSLIQERLKRQGYDYAVVNAGVSGDTSAGALRRLDWALSQGQPKVLLVALGGNDGLRGLPPEQLEQNLAAIIERGQKRGMTVILAGMEAPPNFGADYTERFRGVYPTLAKRYNVRLIPFLLAGVAGSPDFNQPDGIHPNQRGAQMVADLVWPAIEPALERPTTSR